MQESRSAFIGKLNDGWLRIIGIPVVALLITFFFYSEEWIIRGHSFSFCFLTSLSVTTIIWYLIRSILLYFRRTYTTIENTGRRILIQLFSSVVASAIVSVMISWFYDLTGYWSRSLVWQDYLYNLFVIEIFVLSISGIYEGVFYFARWRFSVRETEELKKANLQSQFESLKNQVSPHFLFNSLNTLSSLIEENPATAIRFVNQLSKVYRYLLQSNEKELTTVKDELDFLDAYFFLLKTRFGEGLSIHIDLPDELMSSLIPPLTFQILIENAVKHNIVSSVNPLVIEIRENADKLIEIVNNKQKKTINVASNGLGLTNIAAKYKLLNKPSIRIDDGHKEFIVCLPVIIN